MERKEERMFQEMVNRLNSLENKVKILDEKLSQFKILYKRPEGTDYETLAETLDYLHKALDRRS